MTRPSALEFPADFLWGVATAAYQIEGAVDEGGRGRSVWDTFCATPGKITNGDTGATACDHYHRYCEDIALMAELGVGAYRFSVGWPRIQPDGTGPANPEGLAFYDRLVDDLCSAGIAPVVTLFHWDTPQALEDSGGWLSRDTALRFADYAGLVGERLADRVRMWITLNEPAVVTLLGYGVGEHAPGRAMMFNALPSAHHQLLGHGLAVRSLRAVGADTVGITNNHSPAWPASSDPADLHAAEAYSALHNWLFSDPLLLGKYPGPMLELLPDGLPDDLSVINTPIDFYGVNYYNPTRLGAPSLGNPLPFDIVGIEEYPKTAFGSPVVPDGFREVLVSLADRYGNALPPVYITENGASYDDVVAADGGVHDPDRIDYLGRHLASLRAAMDAGVDVRGYFVWTLIDNFEWAAGYSQRFGLVYVDHDTQVRTPKDSFHWLRAALRG